MEGVELLWEPRQLCCCIGSVCGSLTGGAGGLHCSLTTQTNSIGVLDLAVSLLTRSTATAKVKVAPLPPAMRTNFSHLLKSAKVP